MKEYATETQQAFAEALSEWGVWQGAAAGEIALDDEGEVTVDVREEPVSLAYREETDTVILWADCGELENPAVCRDILTSQYRFADTFGFTIGYDPECRRVAIFDRRPAERLASVEALDAWLTAAAEVIGDVRLAAAQGVGSVEWTEI